MIARTILIVDAIINLALGILLLLFTSSIIDTLGVPTASSGFYPNILGAVLIGIAIALLIAGFESDRYRAAGDSQSHSSAVRRQPDVLSG